ncbi:U5 snRNP-specific protein [Cardiosporidium cionae]|uniref:U5 snRNP-specific protein n=1 Tax=Cardiosporidium cionae TaxID=476202 RepID=A0ABQ7J787_9APIC|nr:U5 snRNP-specific protein [Cardiosporidium cionae]|eukprot:KAF8819855.1 U5 snRNP-specific protein [Cardiosporidium cionae]
MSLRLSAKTAPVLTMKTQEDYSVSRNYFGSCRLFVSHQRGEIFGLEFSPDGRNLASGGFDKNILIYNIYGECENWCVLKGHQNAILEMHWSSDSRNIFSCSADRSLAVWDVENGRRIKKFSNTRSAFVSAYFFPEMKECLVCAGGHVSLVNSCNCARRGPPLLVSGSDDGTTKVWDLRTRKCSKTYESQYQVLSVTFDDNASRIFSGSLDNTIRAYDLRMDSELEALQGHTDSITGLDVSKDGRYLLSNSMDQTIRLWNIQPYLDGKRCMGIMNGATHNFEKNLLRVRWNSSDSLFAAGSADRYVYVWCMKTSRLLYRLPGHNGSVNEVCFHPYEPIVASCSSDKTIYMGELETMD